jgi:hypothetical protein
MKFLARFLAVLMLPFFVIGFLANFVAQGVVAGWWLCDQVIKSLGEK